MVVDAGNAAEEWFESVQAPRLQHSSVDNKD